MAPASPPVHPQVHAARAAFHPELVEEVARAVAENDVVVVGVAGLQPGRRARRLLEAQGVAYRYLEFGSYFSGWRKRLALKCWVQWPTFPHIFIRGVFVGGASDLERLVTAGELKTLLAAPRPS